MSDWTVQRVEQLAPDGAAAKAAHGLAAPGKWRTLGRTGHLVWGECQGSGSSPYQVRVDLEDVAYKCSCPSRKLPCKHTLGLLLLLANGTSMAPGPAPGFVEEWSANRAKRAESRAAKAAAPEQPVDAEQQARRVEKRESRIDAGLDQLERWLGDLVAQGLAAARSQPVAYWSQMAARLVDAQAPALARRVRHLGEVALTAEEWPSAMLTDLARLQMLIDGYRRLDALPAALAAELRTAVGWTQSQDALRGREGVRDVWQVLGRRQSDVDDLRVQHTWVAGQATRRTAVLLEFAAGKQALASSYVTGQVFDATLVFYEGEPEVRATLRERHGPAAAQPLARLATDIESLQRAHAGRLARNPWLDRWPVVLGPVRPDVSSSRGALVDVTGRSVLLPRRMPHLWHLVALAVREPLIVFGEWDGRSLDPVSVECGDGLYAVTSLGDVPVLARVA